VPETNDQISISHRFFEIERFCTRFIFVANFVLEVRSFSYVQFFFILHEWTDLISEQCLVSNEIVF